MTHDTEAADALDTSDARIAALEAQLASARNDALDEAGLYHGTEVKKLQNAIFTLMLGQREQPLRDAIEHHEISATGIRALKTPTPTEDET